MSKSFIYSGRCGTGKTLRLVLSGYESCREGKKVVLVTFENDGEFIAHKLMFIDKFYKENGRIPTFEEAKSDNQKYDLTRAELYLKNFFIHRINLPRWNEENNTIQQILTLLDEYEFDVLMIDNIDFTINYIPDSKYLFSDKLKGLKTKCDKKKIDLYIARQLPWSEKETFRITEI